MKKWKTKKAIKSQKFWEKGLELLGESMGLGKPFFAAMTFDDSIGEWKICPCCGGKSVEKDILELISK